MDHLKFRGWILDFGKLVLASQEERVTIGIVVYGVCSVLDQVGAAQILSFLSYHRDFIKNEEEKGVEGYQSIKGVRGLHMAN